MLATATLLLCAMLGTSPVQAPEDLHVAVACVAQKPYDRALAPQCDIYIGGTSDASIAFKIIRADPQHPEYPVGTILYLGVQSRFFECELAVSNPPVKLAVGKNYDLNLKRTTVSDSKNWQWALTAN